ncbi:hypothetical protein MKW98_018854, partial [Papaver atlanticum]
WFSFSETPKVKLLCSKERNWNRNGFGNPSNKNQKDSHIGWFRDESDPGFRDVHTIERTRLITRILKCRLIRWLSQKGKKSPSALSLVMLMIYLTSTNPNLREEIRLRGMKGLN